MNARLLALRFALIAAAVSGCSTSPPEPEQAPPEFEVSHPVAREIVDHEEFTGRTDAVDSVQVKSRVSGYLEKIFFTDGDEVKEGAKLFEIDPRPYRAQLDQDRADLAAKKAVLAQKEDIFKRGELLVRNKAIAVEDYRVQKGDYEISQSSVAQAEAKAKLSQLNLDWTLVTAPISGRVSQRLVTPGNLVAADTTLLTTIVSVDPIYVYFPVDERTLLRLRARTADLTGTRDPAFATLQMGLANEQGYPHSGALNFEDNTVDPGTGTIMMRGTFANPRAKGGSRLYSPGLFARIRLNVGQPRPGILVADRTLGTDQGKKFIYVIADNTDAESGETKKVVERRYVQIGDLHQGLREIKTRTKDGALPAKQTVSATDQVVIAGLQRLRPGTAVTPKLVDMPTPAEQGKKGDGTSGHKAAN